MGDTDQKYSPGLVKAMDIVQTITTLAVGGAAMIGINAAVSINYVPILGNFSIHMYLMIIGYVILVSQAIMSMNPTSGWARTFSNDQKRYLHLALQVIGLILGIAGSAYAMSMRNRYNLARTSHGIMGIITLVLMIVNVIGGCVTAFARNLLPPRISRICHTLLGYLTIMFVFITFTMGIEKLYLGSDRFLLFPVIVTVVAIAMLGISISLLTFFFKRL